LVAGEPLAGIGRQFGVAPKALRRHLDKHVAATVRQAAERERERAGDAHGDGLLGELRALLKVTKGVMADAYRGNDLRTVLRGVAEASRLLELQGRILGQIEERASVNVAVVDPATLAAALDAWLARLVPPAHVIEADQ
jgi:hypothetical protein